MPNMQSYTIQKHKPSRKDALAEENEAIAEHHRQLKRDYYERQAKREGLPSPSGTCKNGHPRIPGNLVRRSDGSQECRVCREARRAARNKARRKS